MRPNTPHAVLTPMPSIVRGSHYYVTSTIRDTLYGMLHTFARRNFITNSDNRTAAFLLLTRILAYVHGHFVEGTDNSDRLNTHLILLFPSQNDSDHARDIFLTYLRLTGLSTCFHCVLLLN